jgi:hypothetical protein
MHHRTIVVFFDIAGAQRGRMVGRPELSLNGTSVTQVPDRRCSFFFEADRHRATRMSASPVRAPIHIPESEKRAAFQARRFVAIENARQAVELLWKQHEQRKGPSY